MSTIFFKEAIKGFKTHGAFFPSSNFLIKRMLRGLEFKEGDTIVELGAGTGVFTKHIISILPEKVSFLVFEINPVMASHIRNNIKDERMIIIEDDAVNLRSHLDRLNLKNADYVISGLPLGNFTHPQRHRILSAINDNLSSNGLYVQFQYLLASWFHIKKIFDAKIAGYEHRNLPPAFVYHCKKRV